MMTYTTENTNFWQHAGRNAVQAIALVLVAVTLANTVFAQAKVSQPVAGVHNSQGPRGLNRNQLQIIQQSLRHKTGFAELSFDAQGRLTLGNRNHVISGSATARALLVAAVDNDNLFELANHENSPNVAFARINEYADQIINVTGKRLTIFQVQLDFSDFDRLGGPREAKDSFEIGIALLHELAHGVLKLQDPQGGMAEIGKCDAHINQIRRELWLPERLYYHPSINVVQISTGRVVCASLEFADSHKQYRLSWRADHVSPVARNIAQLQQGLVMAKNR